MRREARVKAMKWLYTMDFNSIDLDTVLACEEESDEIAISLAKNCVEHLDEVDSLIKNSLEKYTIDRLNLVDKAIIRIAVSEMLTKKLAKQIIINEALEITKEYSDQGDHKATAFNNRLLDNISKKI